MDGIGRVVASLTPEFLKCTDHDFLLLYHEDGTRERLEVDLGALRRVWRRLPYPLLSPADLLDLPRRLARLGIDAYYTFNYLTSPLHRGYRVAGMVQDLIPFLHRETVSPDRPGWRLFYATTVPTSLMLRRFDRIHVPSARTGEDLARLFPPAASKVSVVPYAVAPPREISPADVERELTALGLRRGYVLYVGRFDPYKNVSALVEAHRSLPSLLRKERPLVLVGRASPEVERVAAADPCIVTTGPLADLEATYRGARVFAYPSLYEGFGLPPLEAMSRGVPVITTDRGSLPEVVGNAAVRTDGTSAQLASELGDLLRDPDRRRDLAERGKHQAAKFSWEAAAGRILDDLSSL